MLMGTICFIDNFFTVVTFLLGFYSGNSVTRLKVR